MTPTSCIGRLLAVTVEDDRPSIKITDGAQESATYLAMREFRVFYDDVVTYAYRPSPDVPGVRSDTWKYEERWGASDRATYAASRESCVDCGPMLSRPIRRDAIRY